jgi:hypothetical protein
LIEKLVTEFAGKKLVLRSEPAKQFIERETLSLVFHTILL